MPGVVRDAGAGVILMHMQGTPATMQQAPEYPEGVVAALDRFFQSRLQRLAGAGIAAERVVLDPGIGFGKTDASTTGSSWPGSASWAIGRPVCLGVSRKGFLGRLTDRPVRSGWPASLAVAVRRWSPRRRPRYSASTTWPPPATRCGCSSNI